MDEWNDKENKQPLLSRSAFSIDVETDYDNLQPYFYESDGENTSFYMDKLVAFPGLDAWKKFHLLTSPVATMALDEDRFEENSNVDISFFLKRARNDSLTLQQKPDSSAIGESNLILREDFMWSAPPLEALGFGPKPTKSPEKPSACCLPDMDFARSTPTTDFMSKAMDSDDESNCSEGEGQTPVCDVANVSKERGYYGNESDCSESGDEEEEEVDVVSLSRSRQKPSTLTVATSSCSDFPTADVAACMHNYYSINYRTPLPSPHLQGQGHSMGGPVSQPGSAKKRPAPLALSPVHLSRTGRAASTSSVSPPSSLLAFKNSNKRRKVIGAASRHGISMATTASTEMRYRSGSGYVMQRREMHNVLERQRRDDLRGNFVSLRDLLPGCSGTLELQGSGSGSLRERMPKVTILRRSADHIRALRRAYRDLSEELSRVRLRHGELRAHLDDLEKDAAECAQWG